MKLRAILFVSLIALAACGSGSGTASTPAIGATPAGTNIASNNSTGTLVPTSFAIGLPKTTAAKSRVTPQYLGSSAGSVKIVLNTVNGNSPPGGLNTTVVSTITPGNCPCSVTGPLVPPGTDKFTFTTYDDTLAQGNALSTFVGSFAIAAGSANSGNSVTLLGIPAAIAVSGAPALTAGTALGTPATLLVAVEDMDGNTITGTYANPVTMSVSDTSGAQGAELSVNGAAANVSVTTTASTDVVKLSYGGLAIPTFTIDSSATGASGVSAPITVGLSPIVYSGPTNGSSAPEIDLYAPTGTGSTGAFTASEVGWTNAPYSKSLAATTSGCASIGTISPASGTSFTFTSVSSQAAGTCTITLTDGASQTKTVTGTYTSSGFGVN